MGTDNAATLSVVGFNLFWFQLAYEGGAEMIEPLILANPELCVPLQFQRPTVRCLEWRVR